MTFTSSRHPLLVLPRGELFASRYVIEERVGQGGMGAVYRARDRALDEVVALKILAPMTDITPDVARLFRQEVKLSRRITHANVVRVYDIGEEQELLYMTMEYIQGQTLRQAINATGGGMTVADVLRIGLALIDGLAAVHGHGILHRDLKPANVMIDKGGRVLLTDFGVAMHFEELASGLVGTIRYMAPEQFRKGKLGPPTDLYSFALVLLEALTGDVPFRDRNARLPVIDPNAISLANRVGDGDPALLDDLERLLRSCLAEDPGARPSSAEQVRASIAALIRDHLTAREHSLAAPTQKRQLWPELVGQLGTKGIAVLSFRHVGPPELSHLGTTLADELVDSLASCRGLRVLGTGATAAFVNMRDPMAMGEKLGVMAVVDGTIQTMGEKSRLVVRLLDTRTGQQSWSEQHEGTISELMAFQPTLIRRLAENLRVEVTTQAYATGLPGHVVDEYFLARHDVRLNDGEHLLSAFERFHRCVELAPDFLPAIAARAVSAVRCWFWDRLGSSSHDWESESLEAVDRAISRAPELSDSHLAAGMFATQRCEFHRALRSLHRAVQLAPTAPAAHEYLGMVLSECGRLDDSMRHLRFALELDPSRIFALVQLARHAILRADYDGGISLLDEADRRLGNAGFGALMMYLRIVAWKSGRTNPRLSTAREAIVKGKRAKLAVTYHGVLEGSIDASTLRSDMHLLMSDDASPRAFTTAGQQFVEMWMMLGHSNEALEILKKIANMGLVDIAWLERCPLLTPLRTIDEFSDIERKVRLQAQALWI